ncbi:MFS transporter [Bariatricus sp. HCP28S3_A7]|uniref:MFS transporter n=1 Tax=Bariatricus sp. HCP28S3_A7 TaxID=3438894 RepID=UPI003F8B6982
MGMNTENQKMTLDSFNHQKISMFEKLAYGMSNMGGNICNTAIASFITLYYTDSVGIAAATVGTMLLIARIFDAVSDIVMGTIIDKTDTKWGQARPWFILSIIPFVLSTILVFAVPDGMSTLGKTVYMYVTYIFAGVICYTVNSLAAVSMQSLMTGDTKERMGLNAPYQIFGFVSIIGVNMITINLVGKFGWKGMAVLYALISMVILFITGIVCKERRCLVEMPEENGKETKITFRQGFPVLLRNKYFYIVLILSISNYITINTFNAGGVYYAMYILGNGNLFGLMTIAGMLPTILLTTTVPYVGNKLGKKNTLILGYVLQAIGFVIVYVAGTNLPMLIAGLVIKGVGLAPIASLLIPMIGDIIEYEERCSGLRLAGLFNSTATFGVKAGSGLGAALVGWLLAWGGYVASAAVQNDTTILAMRIMIAGIPIICSIVGVVLSLAFDIEKKVNK